MSPEELREYAIDVILDHARDVEFSSLFDMAEHHLGHEIDIDDAHKVDRLITRATITVSWEADR